MTIHVDLEEVTSQSQFRKLVIEPLMTLAAIHEHMMATGEDIVIPKPLSVEDGDLCPECGGTMRDWPAWIGFARRCRDDWHDEITEEDAAYFRERGDW